MEVKQATLNTYAISNKSIRDSIEFTKKFIMAGMNDLAIAELESLERLVEIQKKFVIDIFTIKQEYIDNHINVNKTEAK